ncbi:hypothetical protein DF107_09095 [Burkholderia stagnalis]|uniref:hypothetical protein n=1 Tax=Burkholderia stagnalis TaxID=1503054 RepID=UPI000F59A922|nr:hypothetical protein [Burkholderia stagnalis]RQQ13293.1 hypothetical protein DF161_20515 [Burkholderia stagnalis]RQR03966.1 hypothetical protein DF031_04480 [Burkholderia stagnalis]RQX93772.1 hypothetical protein DF120_10230 [Burkholderia stagnalis]RQY83008.1 hypothetical protein DF107_09095 [Burkholderia stagnalis]
MSAIEKIRAELHASLLAGRDTTKIRARLRDAEQAARIDAAALASEVEKQSAALDAAATAIAVAARERVAAALQPFDFTE